MSRASLSMDNNLQRYLVECQRPVSDVERRLLEHTAGLPGAGMQIAVEQARLMELLIRLMGARRCLEIGTFTGYSALAVARALPSDGLLVAMDVNSETTAAARAYWEEAGVAGKIDLRIAPALDTLSELLDAGEAGCFDAAFIDADKANYGRYFETCLELLRPGGLIMVDNVLWSGRVADPENHEPNTEAIRAFNRAVRDDPRVDHCVVPIADGLTLAIRRPEPPAS